MGEKSGRDGCAQPSPASTPRHHVLVTWGSEEGKKGCSAVGIQPGISHAGVENPSPCTAQEPPPWHSRGAPSPLRPTRRRCPAPRCAPASTWMGAGPWSWANFTRWGRGRGWGQKHPGCFSPGIDLVSIQVLILYRYLGCTACPGLGGCTACPDPCTILVSPPAGPAAP